MTAEELLKKAAACQACGKEHKLRRIAPSQGSWAAAGDGHPYQPTVPVAIVAQLRYLATGRYEDPWTPKESIADKVTNAASTVGAKLLGG